ncbi:MAG: beta-propeller domain-containing protein [Oscillospiraceae bacterium]|nr:beta-propeller domain-containing protein [Oscillospiraceae bacterium]
MKQKRNRILSLLLACGLLAALLTGCGSNNAQASTSTAAENSSEITNSAGETVSVTEPVVAESYDELYNAFLSVQKAANEIYDASEDESLNDEAQPVNSDVETYGDPNYTLAMAPTEGVTQGDLIVADDQYIYMVCGSELVIVSAAGANTAEVGRTFVTGLSAEGYQGGETAQKVYLSGSNLFVITYEYLYQSAETESGYTYNSSEKVHVKQYDVSDPANPTIVSDYAQSGRYLGSYLSGGVLYLIGAYSIWSPDQSNPGTFIPTVTKNGEDALLDVGSIWICPGLDSTDYTVLAAIDAGTGECLTTRAMTGYNAWSVTDGGSLYLARTSYTYAVGDAYQEAQYSVQDYSYNAYTRLLRLSMDGTLNLQGSGTVDGYLFGQGAMELNGGELYLATVMNGYSYQIFTDETYGFVNYKLKERTSTNAVYALDSGLTTQRSLQDTAAGQTVYSIHFVGTTAYVVGYDDLIPRYAVDMSAGTLKAVAVSGLDSMAHNLYYWDENTEIGVGVATDETGAVNGVQLSAYGLSGTSLQQQDSTFVSEQWTQAMNNPSAVQVLPDQQMIAVPTDTGYQLYTWQDGSLTAAGSVEMGYVSAGTRLLLIGDCWYFCNDATVVAASAADLSQLAKVEFAYG